MQFKEVLQQNALIFFDGPMETRIEYGKDLTLDKEMSIFVLAKTQEGRDTLAALYRTDIDVAIGLNVPIILNAPTFRASREHCKRLGIPGDSDAIFEINKRCIDLVRSIRDEYPDHLDDIIITAPIGPKFAGFTPDQASDLQAEIEYHKDQINSVVKAGVDFISIAAMPGGIEAIGSAIAASETDMDYTVGLVLTAKGTLLDGMPLDKVIREIDQATEARQPLGYIISCTHPTTAQSALQDNKPEYVRIMGIKANGSARAPKELLGLEKPEADDPKLLAHELLHLGSPRGFKIYGGCCGTDHSHLKSIIEALR